MGTEGIGDEDVEWKWDIRVEVGDDMGSGVGNQEQEHGPRHRACSFVPLRIP